MGVRVSVRVSATVMWQEPSLLTTHYSLLTTHYSLLAYRHVAGAVLGVVILEAGAPYPGERAHAQVAALRG